MFLKRILLENVRSIGSCEISFERGPEELRRQTIVIGENGTGRSTILRAIGLLLAGRNALPTLLSDSDLWIRNGSKSCSMLAEILSPENESLQIEIGIKRGDDSAAVLERNRVSLARFDELTGKNGAGFPVFGYGVSRRASTAQSDSPFVSGRARDLITLFSSDAALPSFESWALDPVAQRKNGVALMRAAFDGLLPSSRFHGVDRRKRRISFETPDGILPLAQLGDGEQALVAWFGDLFRSLFEKSPGRKNPLAASGLLLIDEPELHLHPAHERLLPGILAEKLPNVQIVAATHSAVTAHQADQGELFQLFRPDAGEPSEVRQYEGDPSRLMLHQLLVSPLFGLETGDSAPVERMRREFRHLKAESTASQTPAERRRSRDLEEEIRDLPRWNSMLPGEEEKRALLEQIASAIAIPREPRSR